MRFAAYVEVGAEEHIVAGNRRDICNFPEEIPVRLQETLPIFTRRWLLYGKMQRRCLFNIAAEKHFFYIHALFSFSGSISAAVPLCQF